MIQTKYKIRVRYGETDRMGVLYHGHYATYYEISRTDCIRKMGITYHEIEEQGILMPVTEMNIKFIAPALYDEVVEVTTTIEQIPAIRMILKGEMHNEKGQLINRSQVTLVFLDAASRRIISAPEMLLSKMRTHF